MAKNIVVCLDGTNNQLRAADNTNVVRLFNLFGFSRGAYNARALTGMLDVFGVFRKGSENLVPYAVSFTSFIAKAVEATSVPQQRPSSISEIDQPSGLNIVGGWFVAD